MIAEQALPEAFGNERKRALHRKFGAAVNA